MAASQNHESGFHICINNSRKVSNLSNVILLKVISSLLLEANCCGRPAKVPVQLLDLVLDRVGDVNVLGVEGLQVQLCLAPAHVRGSVILNHKIPLFVAHHLNI